MVRMEHCDPAYVHIPDRHSFLQVLQGDGARMTSLNSFVGLPLPGTYLLPLSTHCPNLFLELCWMVSTTAYQPA